MRMKKVQYNFPDDMHVKSLIRGGMDRINFCGNPHTVDTPLIAYTSYGARCENRPWQPMNFDKAYLKHFTTKSLQEWIEGKLKKGTADRPYNVFQQTYADRYFRINEVTEDKINYLNLLLTVSCITVEAADLIISKPVLESAVIVKLPERECLRR